jgi:hypothetical protein
MSNATLAGESTLQQSTGQFLGRLIESVRGPMRVVAGCNMPPTDGRPGASVTEDEALLSKTKGVRRKLANGKSENLLQLFARTGISRHQLATLEVAEIVKFCAVAESNEEWQSRVDDFTPKVVLPRVLLVP